MMLRHPLGGGLGVPIADLAESTDAEIVELWGHAVSPGMSPDSPAWAGGDDPRVVMAGGDAGAATQTPLTPEEEVELFVAAGQTMGLSPEDLAKARAYAEAKLKESRGG